MDESTDITNKAVLLVYVKHVGRGLTGTRELPTITTAEDIFSSVMWAEKLGKQLGHPTRTVAGWLVSRYLKAFNHILEESAVQLCGIQPGDTVLELGHGPGLGLQSAAKLLTEPTGHLIGVDYSAYMHQTASERLKEFVASGKVTLHHCDIAAMPLADSLVDRVFHCGLMVTVLRLSSVDAIAAKRVLPGENWRPDAYMTALRDTGFTDVRMEDIQHKHITVQAIYATASKSD